MLRMLSIKQAVAQVEGMSEYALRKLINEGQLPVVRAGCKILINEKALSDYLYGSVKSAEPEVRESFTPFEIKPVSEKI